MRREQGEKAHANRPVLKKLSPWACSCPDIKTNVGYFILTSNILEHIEKLSMRRRLLLSRAASTWRFTYYIEVIMAVLVKLGLKKEKLHPS